MKNDKNERIAAAVTAFLQAIKAINKEYGEKSAAAVLEESGPTPGPGGDTGQ